MGRFVCAVFLALATLVPVAASAGAPEDVASAIDRWAATFNANDVDALAKLYTPDAVFVGTTGSTLIEGNDDIRKYFSRLEKSGDKVSIGIRKIVVLDDNVAYVTMNSPRPVTARPENRRPGSPWSSSSAGMNG